MFLTITFDPKDVVTNAEGKLVLNVRSGNPSLPAWLVTSKLPECAASDARHLVVTRRGKLKIGQQIK